MNMKIDPIEVADVPNIGGNMKTADIVWLL